MTTISLAAPVGAPALGAPANVVDIHDPYVVWDTHLILHGIPLSIPSSQTVVPTGTNGSGKSTLLHALLATAPITRGSVRLFGMDDRDSRIISWKRIDYVPQRISLGGPISASSFEVVMSELLGRRRWWNSPADKDKAMAALKRVGLAHRVKDPLAVLSGGQAQRVLIARALVQDPELLAMDEPMTGTDQTSRERLAQIILESKDATTAIFIVLHKLGELGPLLDRELHIGLGHISYDGAPHVLDDHEQHADEGGHHHVHPTAPTGPTLVDDILKGAQ